MLPGLRLFALCISPLLFACTDPGDDDANNVTDASSTSDASSIADASMGDMLPTSDSTANTGEPSPWDGEPLPEPEPGQWQWVAFPDAFCRDGSETGIGIRRGAGDGLMIYFQGGGACFNTLTCATNPSSFGAADFSTWMYSGESGIFATYAAENPLGDWNVIFVPYCTGDVHAGDNRDVVVPDVDGTQHFVGYSNVAAYLERIVPTFAGVSHVLVTGESAGGFGAGFNYDRIVSAFPGSAVTLLDDSGPPLSDKVLAPCLQQQWRDLWGLDRTLPPDCSDCFQPDGGGIVELGRFLAKKHSSQRLALISSTADSVIRFFFGYGADNCSATLPDTPPDDFKAALIEARDLYLNEPAGVWGTYFVDFSDQHTFLTNSYYSTTVDGVVLVDWVRGLLEGKATNLGPG